MSDNYIHDETVTVDLKYAAKDPKQGLTLKELTAVVDKANSLHIPDTFRVRVEVGWGGQAKTIHLHPNKKNR